MLSTRLVGYWILTLETWTELDGPEVAGLTKECVTSTSVVFSFVDIKYWFDNVLRGHD